MAANLTAEQKGELAGALARELSHEPTICVVGVSGTSKSSTINTLFKTSLPVSHTVAPRSLGAAARAASAVSPAARV